MSGPTLSPAQRAVAERVAKQAGEHALLLKIDGEAVDIEFDGHHHRRRLVWSADGSAADVAARVRELLTAKLDRATGSGSRIRYRIAGNLVGLVPFGDVEDPAGQVRLRAGGDQMSVFAFREVYSGAVPITLSSGVSLRVPSPAGYTALKLKAWADRRSYNEAKDGRDLGTAMSWYQGAPRVHDRLYAPGENDHAASGVLEAAGFDPAISAVMLLARDAMSAIGQVRHDELRELWQSIDDDLLETDLGPRRLRQHAGRAGRHDPRVVALRAAINGPTPEGGGAPLPSNSRRGAEAGEERDGAGP